MASLSVSASHLHSLKNALQDRFPAVKSSHLSEALASALGFRTHASLLADLRNATGDQKYLQLDSGLFLSRLQQLGHSADKTFSFDKFNFGSKDTGIPSDFQALISRLVALEAAPQSQSYTLHLLRRHCATIFGKAFDIGYPEPLDEDKKRVKRFTCGIDYKACEAGWGDIVNPYHAMIDFPGSDHRVQFCERLPLSNGRYVEYTAAMVSMPYTESTRIEKLPEARAMAQRIGWECTQLDEWSWYAHGATALILFRRKSSHAEMLDAWNGSFKQWLMEYKSRLMKSAGDTRRKVILDAIDCQHLPLDVRDYADFRERYLKEFAPRLYHTKGDSMAKIFEKLFDKWHADQPS